MKSLRKHLTNAPQAELLHDILDGLSLVILLIVALSVVPVA
jgi:hypothetical protein